MKVQLATDGYSSFACEKLRNCLPMGLFIIAVKKFSNALPLNTINTQRDFFESTDSTGKANIWTEVQQCEE